jgi:Flp pilus assembly secretin CpaC
MKRLLSLALTLLSFAAFAGPLSLRLGEIKKITVSRKITKVVVSDPEVLDAKLQGNVLQLRGKISGISEVTVWTTANEQIGLDVHVTPSGIYALSRAD